MCLACVFGTNGSLGCGENALGIDFILEALEKGVPGWLRPGGPIGSRGP